MSIRARILNFLGLSKPMHPQQRFPNEAKKFEQDLTRLARTGKVRMSASEPMRRPTHVDTAAATPIDASHPFHPLNPVNPAFWDQDSYDRATRHHDASFDSPSSNSDTGSSSSDGGSSNP